MFSLSITDGFDEWRQIARRLSAANVSPEEVLWTTEASPSLFSNGLDDLPTAKDHELKVPKAYIDLARTVSHHASDDRWSLLYRVLYRLTHGGEPHLLNVASDPDVAELMRMRKSIGRDVHKMHAFVRFKKVSEDTATGREQFVAWFEPEHRIMPLTANFFRKRFTGMDWSIFTPTGSAHWDGKSLRLTEGIPHMDAPSDVELEVLWRSYYKSIFNPARIKTKAMQAEMPKKYWRNLPEAELIAPLIAGGNNRVEEMLDTEERPARDLNNNRYLNDLADLTKAATVVAHPDDYVGSSLPEIREAVMRCRACQLCEKATATVAGEGPDNAKIMIIGEQPGDQEDISGRPFVGPAGQLLDKALAAAGIDRSTAYLTNAVKHFKWKPSPHGKRRLHQNPSRSETVACKPWMIAELMALQPEVVICLGATAAKSLIDSNFRLTQQRGLVAAPDLAPTVIATFHPSYLLRLPDGAEKNAAKRTFLADLKLAFA